MPFSSNNLLTLSTDFGTADGYVGAMKGRALSESPGVRIVDITHDIPPWDIRRAAFSLWTSLPLFPAGTVHVVVVDPGVGTDRRALVALVGDQAVIAPDNGIISLLLERDASLQSFTLPSSAPGITPSKTFHGRDIFAPMGARIAAGAIALPAHLAPLSDPVRFPCGYTHDGTDTHGTLLCADRFGNLITTIPWSEVASPRNTSILVGGIKVDGFVQTYGDAAPGALVALEGSSGLLEISCAQASAQQRLNISPGTSIVVSQSP